jgi:hypothetical protein
VVFNEPIDFGEQTIQASNGSLGIDDSGVEVRYVLILIKATAFESSPLR